MRAHGCAARRPDVACGAAAVCCIEPSCSTSHVFDRVPPEKIVTGARHPRNNPAWPRVGIFAQRGKNRPNRLGVSVVRIVGVDGARLHVAELDAIDGTPVVDIKPVLRELLPRGELRQPSWASELMAHYW